MKYQKCPKCGKKGYYPTKSLDGTPLEPHDTEGMGGAEVYLEVIGNIYETRSLPVSNLAEGAG